MKKGMVEELRRNLKMADNKVCELMTILKGKEQTISILYNLLLNKPQEEGFA